MTDRQVQRAGNDATQVQVMQNELTPEQLAVVLNLAREVATDQARHAAAEYSLRAQADAQDRIDKLNDRVLSILASERRLGSFQDPGFQWLLRKAQIGAATTDRDADHDLLATLLSERARTGAADRLARAALERAVEIVDKSDDQAVAALTAFSLLDHARPVHASILVGMRQFDRYVSLALPAGPPTSDGWVEHLFLLDAITINYVKHYKKWADFFPQTHLTGYLSSGVPAGSEEEAAVVARLLAEAPTLQFPVLDHELKPGFRRVGATSANALLGSLPAGTSPAQSELVQWAAERMHLSEVDSSLLLPLVNAWDSYPHNRALREWWDSLPQEAPTPTQVGRIIGRANLRRLTRQ